MMFVHFDGDGQIIVSETVIRPHISRPDKLRAFDANEAVRLTGLSWTEEHVYIEAETLAEEGEIRRAIHARVNRDLHRDPRSWGPSN